MHVFFAETEKELEEMNFFKERSMSLPSTLMISEAAQCVSDSCSFYGSFFSNRALKLVERYIEEVHVYMITLRSDLVGL